MLCQPYYTLKDKLYTKHAIHKDFLMGIVYSCSKSTGVSLNRNKESIDQNKKCPITYLAIWILTWDILEDKEDEAN